MAKSQSKKISSSSKQPSEYAFLSKRLSSNKFNFILGILIVFVVAGLIFTTLKTDTGESEKSIKDKITQLFTNVKQKDDQSEEQKSASSYKVKLGDTLWSIAEEKYGSGFNSYDIARANKLANPDVIEINQTLTLPSIQPRAPTTGEVAQAQTSQVTFTGAEYTVRQGDCLWTIAIQVYGDGYSWPKIAEANKIANPDIIYPEQKFSIPR